MGVIVPENEGTHSDLYAMNYEEKDGKECIRGIYMCPLQTCIVPVEEYISLEQEEYIKVKNFHHGKIITPIPHDKYIVLFRIDEKTYAICDKNLKIKKMTAEKIIENIDLFPELQKSGIESLKNVETASTTYIKQIEMKLFNDKAVMIDITSLDYEIHDTEEVVVTGPKKGTEAKENVIIPDCVDRIGKAAFVNKKSIKHVTIGDNVTNTEGMAFAGCTNLKTLKLGKNIRDIWACAFRECAIQELKLNEGLRSIDIGAFEDCIYLEKVEFNNKIETICHQAFAGTALKSVVINSDNLRDIQIFTFASTKLDVLDIYNTGITHLNMSIFETRQSRKDIVQMPSIVRLPKGLISLECNIFFDTSRLKELFIPKTLEKCSTIIEDSDDANVEHTKEAREFVEFIIDSLESSHEHKLEHDLTMKDLIKWRMERK